MKILFFCLFVLLKTKEIWGAADFDVERVSSPYVEAQDVGQMMQSGNNQHDARLASVPLRPYSTLGRQVKGCLTCQHGMGGASSSGSSSYSSGSYSYGSGAVSPQYSPPQSSSSRHEMRKEKEFMNGQQIYDFHHEKKYQDGKLVDESRHEKTPENFGNYNQQPGGSMRYSSYGSYNIPSSSSSGSESSWSSSSSHSTLPQTSYQQNQFQEAQHSGYGVDTSFDDHFEDEFEKEVERMREELRRKTASNSHQVVMSPASGGSHRSEFKKETKYVNGKPVYTLNEERKYKDGQLIHNVRDEKGPEDLGTSHVLTSSPVLTSPTGGKSSQYHEEVYSQSQQPTVRYPIYRPSTYLSSESASSHLSSSKQQPYYRPSSVYSSETVDNRQEVQSKSHGTYNPDSFYQPRRNDNDDLDERYRQPQEGNSYYRPDTSTRRFPTPAPTTTTTERPSLIGYDSSPIFNRPGQVSQPALKHSYEEQTSSTRYSHNPERYNYIPDTANSYRSNDKPDSEEHIQEASESSYYDLKGHKIRPTSQSHPDQVPSYRTGTFSTYSEEKETEARHQTSSQPNRVVEAPRNYQPRTHVASSTQEEHSKAIASKYYPTNTNIHRPEDYDHDSNEIYDSPTGGASSSRTYQPRTHSTSSTQEEHSKTIASRYYPANTNLHRPEDYDHDRNEIDDSPTGRESSPRNYQPRTHATSSTHEELSKTIASRYYPANTNIHKPEDYDHDRNEIDDSPTGRDSSPRNYQPRTHATSSTQEEHSKTIASRYYPTNTNIHRSEDYDHERNEIDDSPTGSAGAPNYAVPGFISGPEVEHRATSEEEERYDISPYDDASEADQREDKTDESTHQYGRHPTQRPNYRPQNLPEPDRLIGNNQVGYSSFNSSRTDHITKVLPSRWVETKTTWKYMNGKLVSETQHHRYYENGVLIHENSTRRTRDEMVDDGIDVSSLDLTTTQLSEYGPAIASTAHSQKHEMHQIKRFKNGQQIYELNHERRFQDGNLVHEDRDEKDEDDFGLPNYATDGYHRGQSHHLDRQSVEGGTGLYSTGGVQTVVISPKSYSRKHEIRQEEEFVNGQKVYDLHHEKKYQDGKLVHENKTELGPNDLGAQTIQHRDALKDILAGRTHNSLAHNSLHEQQHSAGHTLKTSCITCGTVRGGTAHSQGHILGAIGVPASQVYNAGSSYRQDMNVEEHYENGQLVKGREEKKKWIDGQLVDADEEHYYEGPSRANISTNLASGHSSSSSLSAFSSAPAGSVTKISGPECSYNPCRNKGTCKESVRGPICICAFGYKGQYCEEAYCPSRYCRYGGSCTIEDDKHVCVCAEGYSGYRCSTIHHKIRMGVSG